MLIRAPNITGGPGGVTAAYKPVDWVRAIRHGIRPNGRPLMVMPSEEYNRLTDADLAAVVAYIRQLPPKSGEGATIRLPLPCACLRRRGGPGRRREDRPSPAAVAAGRRGRDRGPRRLCRPWLTGCHRADLSGGKIAGAPPSWPAAARLGRAKAA